MVAITSVHVPPYLSVSSCMCVCQCAKQLPALWNKNNHLGMNSSTWETSIFQSGVSRKRERQRGREKHESGSEGGDPCHSKAFPWLTELVRLRICVYVSVCVSLLAHVPFPHTHPTHPNAHHCVYHLCHLSSNQEFKSMTLSKTIIATP